MLGKLHPQACSWSEARRDAVQEKRDAIARNRGEKSEYEEEQEQMEN